MDDLTISDAPIPADQWLRLTVDALKDLGGALQMVPGAKLRQRMVEIGAERKLDVAAHVQATDHLFSRLVEQVDGVVVTRRAGSDMVVGLRGASTPQ